MSLSLEALCPSHWLPQALIRFPNARRLELQLQLYLFIFRIFICPSHDSLLLHHLMATWPHLSASIPKLGCLVGPTIYAKPPTVFFSATLHSPGCWDLPSRRTSCLIKTLMKATIGHVLSSCFSPGSRPPRLPYLRSLQFMSDDRMSTAFRTQYSPKFASGLRPFYIHLRFDVVQPLSSPHN